MSTKRSVNIVDAKVLCCTLHCTAVCIVIGERAANGLHTQPSSQSIICNIIVCWFIFYKVKYNGRV